jgi:septum formation protein
MRMVLASKSPRRREILENIGVEFDIVESNVDEAFDPCMSPCDIVKYLAYKKAQSAAKDIKYDALVIGADTIVVSGSDIMGKPENEEQAFDMLKKLSGKWHNVYSGISVIETGSGMYFADYEVTAVKIRQLSDEDIHRYINTKEPFDKAGSYAIHGIGSLIVERMDGCYFNVVGLPVFKLSNILGRFGVNLLALRG